MDRCVQRSVLLPLTVLNAEYATASVLAISHAVPGQNPNGAAVAPAPRPFDASDRYHTSQIRASAANLKLLLPYSAWHVAFGILRAATPTARS